MHFTACLLFQAHGKDRSATSAWGAEPFRVLPVCHYTQHGRLRQHWVIFQVLCHARSAETHRHGLDRARSAHVALHLHLAVGKRAFVLLASSRGQSRAASLGDMQLRNAGQSLSPKTWSRVQWMRFLQVSVSPGNHSMWCRVLYRPTSASEENTARQTVDLTGRLALHR